MCDCIDSFKKTVLESLPEFRGKKIRSVLLPVTFPLNGDLPRVVINVPAFLEGQIKSAYIPIVAAYCPFCGKDYGDLKQ